MFAKLVKNRKYWIAAIVVTLIFGWSGGFFSGWLINKNKVAKLPEVGSISRLLVVAPHPDDEILIAGGLIQDVLSQGGKVKIVYATSGDASRGGIIADNPIPVFTSSEYIKLGIERMNEAKKAMEVLGAGEDDLIFLGFPDQGLKSVLYGQGTASSPATRVTKVPYKDAYKFSQSYTKENLIEDMTQIIKDFKPSVVITTHPRDFHPDHKAAFDVVDETRQVLKATWPIYAVIVHYKGYPKDGKNYLVPPSKLFGSDWLSFDLTQAELTNKKKALGEYRSQHPNFINELFKNLSAGNEIFQVE